MDRTTKNKIKATLFIILFLLLAAVIVYFITGKDGREYYTVPTPRPTMELETATPVPTIIISTPAPIVVETPDIMVIETPVQTPEPTIEITSAPVIVGQIVGRDSFRSDTGAYVDIQADCEASVLSENEVLVSVTVYLDHYSLYSTISTMLNISANGQYYSTQVQPIEQENNAQVRDNIGQTTFVVNCAPGQTISVPVAAEWHFGGTYHGVELPVIECGGMLNITR